MYSSRLIMYILNSSDPMQISAGVELNNFLMKESPR